MDDVKVKAGLRCLSDLYMYCIGNSQERLNEPTNVQRSTTKKYMCLLLYGIFLRVNVLSGT